MPLKKFTLKKGGGPYPLQKQEYNALTPRDKRLLKETKERMIASGAKFKKAPPKKAKSPATSKPKRRYHHGKIASLQPKKTLNIKSKKTPKKTPKKVQPKKSPKKAPKLLVKKVVKKTPKKAPKLLVKKVVKKTPKKTPKIAPKKVQPKKKIVKKKIKKPSRKVKEPVQRLAYTFIS